MLAIAILTLSALTFINYRIGRSLMYPALIFSAVWGVGLFCLLISGNLFYPISEVSLLIFQCGAIAFSIGSALGKLSPQFKLSPPRRDPTRLIYWGVALLIITLPFYVYWLVQLAADQPGEFLKTVRQEVVDFASDTNEGFRTPAYIFFSYVGLMSIIVPMAAWSERLKKTAIASIAVAILYSVLTGGRATAIRLLFGVLCVHLLSARKVTWKTVVPISGCAILIFGVMAVLVHGESERPLSEQLQFASNEVVHYIGGPIVAFDRIVQQPNIVNHHMNAAIFFIETAHRLGFDVAIPSRGSEGWISTGPDFQDNVYTMYFSYLDFGWPFCFLVLAAQGFSLALIFEQAKRGGKVATIVYSYIASHLFLCTFSDFLMGAINPILKIWAISWAFYYFPRLRLGIRLLPRTLEAK